jgi:hypothetical protein
MNSLHTYIQPQLESIIDELIFKGYTAESLSTPLTNINWWWNESPYDQAVIDCDGMRGTFKHLLRTVELITDEYTVFNYNLILQLSITIEARWEIHMKHAQEDYMANYQYELQEVVGL